jgi:hypothetical protein
MDTLSTTLAGVRSRIFNTEVLNEVSCNNWGNYYLGLTSFSHYTCYINA